MVVAMVMVMVVAIVRMEVAMAMMMAVAMVRMVVLNVSGNLQHE